jgi:hypothetical protein
MAIMHREDKILLLAIHKRNVTIIYAGIATKLIIRAV